MNIVNGRYLLPARKPSSLSDCTNDEDDGDDDVSMDDSSGSNSIHHDDSQSPVRSFGVTVGYFDRTPLPITPPALEPSEPKLRLSPTSVELAKMYDVGGRNVQCVGNRLAGPEHPPSSFPVTDAHGLLVTAVMWSPGSTAGSATLEGRADRSNFSDRWSSVGACSRPPTSHAAVFVPLLPAANTATDISDEPEDLSVRAGACHVTATDSNAWPTKSSIHVELQGKLIIYLFIYLFSDCNRRRK